MNWSGNTSKPIRSAEWRSPTKRISTPRSVHPCANYKTTPRKSAPSTKSQLSNTPHDSEPTSGLINNTPLRSEGTYDTYPYSAWEAATHLFSPSPLHDLALCEWYISR